MNKKLTIFCLALAIAALSVSAYATEPYVGTWNDNSGDGWVNHEAGQASIGPMPAVVGNASYAQSAIGAKFGTSLGMNVTATGSHQVLRLSSYQSTINGQVMADFLSHGTFAIDVTYDSGSWPSDTGWAQIYQLTIQTPTYGWHDVGGAAAQHGTNGVKFYDTLNPGYPGGLPLTNKGTPGTVMKGTWIWDYSAILPGGSYTGTQVAATDGYVNFILSMNANKVGTYYFDNARLVPEPATIALLSLGGLALLRRKRA